MLEVVSVARRTTIGSNPNATEPLSAALQKHSPGSYTINMPPSNCR